MRGVRIMMLLTKEIQRKLMKNWRENLERRDRGENGIDFEPVVKFFYPAGSATWLFTELDDEGRLFGLCDLGSPELGYADLAEISDFRGQFGIRVERDKFFKADMTLSEYANEAREKGRIMA
jgi:hypothetical protein